MSIFSIRNQSLTRTFSIAFLFILIIPMMSNILSGTGAFALPQDHAPASRASLPTSGTYYAAAIGDIDHDRDADLIAVSDSGVIAWAGDGQGSWTDKADPTNTGIYYALAIIDINHDGDLDIIAAGTSGVKVWTGNGAWTWTAGNAPISSGTYYTVEAYDLNIDGDADIAAGGAAGIQIRLGDGTGGWTNGNSPTSSNTFFDLAITDLNLDGKPDIAASGNDTAASNGTVMTFLGDGAGAWPSTATVLSSVTGPVYSIDAADLNRDGKPDLVASRNGTIHYWTGNGANVWAQGPAPASPNLNGPTQSRDMNNDGLLDIIVGNEHGSMVWLGDGGTSWPATPALPLHNRTVLGLTIADLDHDAKPDIVAATKGSGLGMWLSDIPDTKITGWSLASTNLLSTGKWADIDFGDVNNDGKLDLLVTSYQSQNKGIRVFTGDGTGTWTNSSTGLPVTSSISGARFSDLNHDGKLDIVAATDEMWTMGVIGTRVWKGNGDGTWTLQTTIDTRAGAGLEIGDFNNDGDTDVCTGYWTNAQGPMIFRGNGDLTFQSDSGPAASAINLDDCTIGDVNNDGKQDFAASTMNNAGVQLWTGDGTGASTSWTRQDTGLPATGVYLGLTMGDVNNDGNTDLAAVAYPAGNGVNIYLSDGGSGGTVDWTEASKGLPLTSQFSAVELADIDLDGDLDVAAGNVSNGGIDLFAGNGGVGGTVNWTEIGKNPLPTTGNIWGLRFGDINNDGIQDIAATPDGSGVRVWKTDIEPVTYFDHVDLTPTVSTINTSETVTFTAQAQNAAHVPVPLIRFVWDIEGPAGIVSLNASEGPSIKLTGKATGTTKLMVTAIQGLFAKGKAADITVVTPPPPKDVTVLPQVSILPGSIWAKGTNRIGNQENATILIGLKAFGRNITGMDRLKLNITLAQGMEPVNGTFSTLPNMTTRNGNRTTVLRWNFSFIENATTTMLKFDINSTNNGTALPVSIPGLTDVRFVNTSGPQVLRLAPLAIDVGSIWRELPGPPLNLKARPGDGFVNLTWDPPALDGNVTVTNYLVYRGTSSGSETMLDEIGNATAYNDTTVNNGVTYFFKLRAVNAIGEGPFSLTVNATPSLGAGLPGPPEGLTAKAGDKYVALNWSPPLNNGGVAIINYTLYRGTSSAISTKLLNLAGTVFNDTSVTNNVTYYYTVTACNTVGEGPRAFEVNATPHPPPPPLKVPSAPRNLKTTAGDSFANLTWEPPVSDGGTIVTGYRIFRGIEPGKGVLLKDTGAILAYKDTNLTNGVTYYYSVAAMNIIGTGPFTAEMTATPWALPGTPQGLKAKGGVEKTEAYISWESPSSTGGFNITGYKVYRSTAGPEGPYELLGQMNTLFYQDHGVKSKTTYWYKVSAVTVKGEGPMTGPGEAKVRGTGGPTIDREGLLFFIGVVVLVVVSILVAIVLLLKRRKRIEKGSGPQGGTQVPVHQQVDLIGGSGQGTPPLPPQPEGPPVTDGREVSSPPRTSMDERAQGKQGA